MVKLVEAEMQAAATRVLVGLAAVTLVAGLAAFWMVAPAQALQVLGKLLVTPR